MILQIIQLQQTAATRLQMGNTKMKQYLTFSMSTLLLLSAQILSAQTWTGTANNNWSDPANWNTMAVPTATGNVNIPNVPNKPTIMAGTAAVAKSVTVTLGGALTINASASLSINGATDIGLFNLGTVNNDGTINIGNVSSITNIGLRNEGTFNNRAKITVGAIASVGDYGIQNIGTFGNTTVGGDIQISRAIKSSLYNELGTFNNEAKITIGSVANAYAGLTGLYNNSIFNNKAGGEITIDRSKQVSFGNGAMAYFDNYGKLYIGLSESGGFYGIQNQKDFVNNAGGDIKVGRAGSGYMYNYLGTVINASKMIFGGLNENTFIGIENTGSFKNTGIGEIKIDNAKIAAIVHNSGGFINEAKIRMGATATVGDYGIQNLGDFDNKTGGDIQIDRAIKSALFIEGGTFNNEAKITLGSIANTHSGQSALYNKSILNNKAGGEITIDRPEDISFQNGTGAYFDNYGKLYIGLSESAGFYGIYNQKDFVNNAGGDIKVGRSGSGYLFNYLGSVINASKMTFGGLGINTFIGIENTGSFKNTGIGEIKIDNAKIAAIVHNSGGFINEAKIRMGATATVGDYGIQNLGDFDNKTGGDIQIDRAIKSALFNENGYFNNSAKISIGGISAPGMLGIDNIGDFRNNGMGEINIDRTIVAAIAHHSGLFGNAAKIRIGAIAPVGENGIYNLGDFENPAGGDLQIDRTTSVAIVCDAGSFSNSAKITIGSIASIGDIGIQNHGPFTNKAGGNIQIDRYWGYGIYHSSGEFINHDKITIGSIASVGANGIFNRSNFLNSKNGEIKIDNFSNVGIYNFDAKLWNAAKITIGEATNGALFSVLNNDNSHFSNDACAILSLFAPIKNEKFFFQNGLLSMTTPNLHSNTGFFANNGIIVYPNGNPIPNVTNSDVIVAPISSNCGGGLILNALQIGNDNSFTIGSTWFKDAAMTMPGGTYNQATNTFTLTSLSAPLFISIQGNGGGCTRKVPIFISVNDITPPTITCPANIVRNTDPNQCYATVNYNTPTATDNCTAPTVAIVPPGLASGAQFPKGINSVTWQATDGAGLTHRCTFTVTVNGASGGLNITCPANQTKSTDAGECSAIVTYVTPKSVDNCGGSAIIAWVSGGTIPTASGANSISTFQKGVTTVQWKATDASNATKTCTFRVTINDTQLPSITCPANQSLTTIGNSCASAAYNYAVTATDNCMPAPTAIRVNGLPSGSIFPKGTSNVTWRAIDGAGNSKTCSFSVTVSDNVLPTISCPSNVAVTAAPGQCSATAIYPNPTAADNCEVQSMYLLSGLASGSLYPLGVTNNVWVATDNSGQSATCSFSVTVICGAEYGSVIHDRAKNEDIQAKNSEITMRLSPNPAITSVAVALEGLGETGGELIVMDAQGKTVWQQVLTNTSDLEQITVSEFTAGIYFVVLRSDRGVVTKRLVVSRN